MGLEFGTVTVTVQRQVGTGSKVTPNQHQHPALHPAPGYMFVELLVVATIVMILASAVLPLAEVTATRQREVGPQAFAARDADRDRPVQGRGRPGPVSTLSSRSGRRELPARPADARRRYSSANDATGRKSNFLRRIPINPMTARHQWGLRAYQDEPIRPRYGGQQRVDVYTTFNGTALDGSRYRDW